MERERLLTVSAPAVATDPSERAPKREGAGNKSSWTVFTATTAADLDKEEGRGQKRTRL